MHGIFFPYASPCNTKSFTQSHNVSLLLQLKIHNIWKRLFQIKVFSLYPGINERNFQSHRNYYYFLMILSADIRFNRVFFKIPGQKPEYISEIFCRQCLFFNRFLNVKFSERCHFVLLTDFLLDKSYILCRSMKNREKYGFYHIMFQQQKIK